MVLEKEDRLAAHQTGRNSGVIHSGIYYKPGSFKARFCKAGNQSMVAFCREHGIAHECAGSSLATVPEELLEKLYQRGIENDLEVRKLNVQQMREIEPHVAGIAGLQVPSTGIVDYEVVAEAC